MKYLKQLASASLITSLLLGCGGGSSSSGVGQPHATPYAGVYEGTMNFRVSAGGASGTTDLPYRVVVGNDGQVAGYSPGLSGDGSCEEFPALYLTGNTQNYSFSGLTCSGFGLGTCTAEGTTSSTFNAASMSESGTYRYFCTGGNFVATFSGLLNKTG